MSTKFEARRQKREEENRLSEQIEEIRQLLPKVRMATEIYREVGLKLQHMRETKLYRIKYKTLDECLKAEFGFSKTWAYRLMHKAEPLPISYKAGSSSCTTAQNATSEVDNSPRESTSTETHNSEAFTLTNGEASLSANGAPSIATVEQEGVKPVDDDPPLVKKSKAVMKSFGKELDALARRKPGGKRKAEKLRATLRTALGAVWEWSSQPDKEIPVPSPEPCKGCGVPVLWVTTSNWRRMMVLVDRSPAGTFDLQGGLAHFVKQEGGKHDRVPLYQRHPYHGKGGVEEPLPA